MSVAAAWYYPDVIPVTVSDILGYQTVNGFRRVEKVEVLEANLSTLAMDIGEYTSRLLIWVGKYNAHQSLAFPRHTIWIAMEQAA